MTMTTTLDYLRAAREHARTYKRAYTKIAALLTQVIDCLENGSITEQQANDYEMHAAKAQPE